MAKALRGNLEKIKDFKARLRELPRTVAHGVAQRAAPELTGQATSAYTGGKSVYGEARPESVNGGPLDLYRTGDASEDLRADVRGTVIRWPLSQKYTKFLIGKYGFLPNGRIPAGWSRILSALVDTAAKAALGK